ncbi:MAG TPA: TonB family protein [Acidobacteriaceae bacterium]|jgi:TonB family protein
MFRAATLLALFVCTFTAMAQTEPSSPAPIERRDPVLDVASSEIGRALFLRCMCSEDNLGFDTQGRLPADMRIKKVDWTLAAVNVQKVERKSPNAIELDGVRVFIHFAADRHEFERRPQKDEAMRITVADNGDPKSFERALGAMFAIGIDRGLQQSMPAFWQHYFEPQLAWPTDSPDALTGQTILTPGTSDRIASGQAPADPAIAHKATPEYTTQAEHDRIQGVVVVRFVVDTEGIPRRIAVQLPLGYGLDEKAVAAAGKLRFTPEMLNGAPVPVNTVIRVEFVLPPGPRR